MISTFSRTSFAGWYFGAQALLITGWWLYLWIEPSGVEAFVPPGASPVELLAFWLPDLLIAVPVSAMASLTFFRRSRWALPLGWAAAGAMGYAFFYCLAWSWQRDGGWINVILMAPAAFFSTVAALDASATHLAIFRRATPAAAARNVAATLGQTVLFWSFFLFAVPAAITAVEHRLQVPMLSFPGQRGIAGFAFVLLSALGLLSGVTMAARGVGTPLPFAAPNRLVISGPYAYVRNPMVLAGLGQGLAVALWLGSFAIVAYVVLGGVIWNFLVCPAEEADLHATFGGEFEDYCRRVRCWIPRAFPFVPGKE